MRVAGMLLAAGASTRMEGAFKLLLPLDGGTVVERSARAALAGGLDPVVAVTGHRADEVAAALAHLPVRVVENREWQAGQASSLAAGVRAVSERPAGDPAVESGAARSAAVEGVAVCLADEPELDPAVVRAALARWRAAGRPALRVVYRDRPGHPVLLHRSLFPELVELEGDRGALELLDARPERVETLEVDGPAPADLDLRRDYQRLLRRRGG